jgi:hypothetical protein
MFQPAKLYFDFGTLKDTLTARPRRATIPRQPAVCGKLNGDRMAKSKSEPHGFCREVGKFYNLLGNVGLVIIGLVAIGITAVYFYFIGYWIYHHWQAAIVAALTMLVILLLGSKEAK